jgi:hypothetical protein
MDANQNARVSQVAYTLKDGGLSILLDGVSYTLNKDHRNYEAVKAALREGRYDEIPDLAGLAGAAARWLTGDPDVAIEAGVVRVREGAGWYAFEEPVSVKVTRMMEEGVDPAPLVAFLKKVLENPSATARRELLLFCVANDFLIHLDGDIVAYKSVDEDYMSIHSGPDGKVRYRVGDRPSMPRARVDDARDRTCSFGLHFASFGFASRFGAGQTRHVMIVKIHPRDVVAIPNDHADQKGRACLMEVIGERKDFTPIPVRQVLGDDVQDADLTAWKAAVASGDTTQSFEDWQEEQELEAEAEAERDGSCASCGAGGEYGSYCSQCGEAL